jgi:catechol 2,3-dioxygenase-like lactoylglutathione lyase family enzyme
VAINGVRMLSVPVSDQDRAYDFYVGALGMEVLDDTPMGPDMRWLRVAPRGSETSITLVTWFPTMPAGSLKGMVLVTDSLEEDVEQLRKAGVAMEDEIQEESWGRYVTFDDPDGNGIILRGASA